MPTKHILRLYQTIVFFDADVFIIGIYLLFLHDVMGYSFAQATSLFTVFWLVSIIFDLLGGGISDVLGNRRSHILGNIIMLSTFYVGLTTITEYWILLGLAAIAGMGRALVSGSLAAYMADRLHYQPSLIKVANSRKFMIEFLARATTTVMGAGLYMIQPYLPFLCFYLFRVIAISLVGFLPPDHTSRRPLSAAIVREGARHAGRSFRYITVTRGRVLLPYLLGLTMVGYVGGDLFFSTYQVIFTTLGLSAFYVGAIIALVSLASATGAWLTTRLKLTQMIIAGPIVIALAGGSLLTHNVWLAIASMCAIGISAGTVMATQQTIISLLTPPGKRAGALSVASTMTYSGSAVAFLIGGYYSDQANNLTLIGLTAIGIAILGSLVYRSNAQWLKKLGDAHATSVVEPEL